MRNHQFAIQTTDLATQVAELTRLKFLPTNWEQLAPKALLGQLLLNSHPAAQSAPAGQQWLAGLAIDPATSAADWLASEQSLTTAAFHLLALQLLGFKADVDYQVEAPSAAVAKINLPLPSP